MWRAGKNEELFQKEEDQYLGDMIIKCSVFWVGFLIRNKRRDTVGRLNGVYEWGSSIVSVDFLIVAAVY